MTRFAIDAPTLLHLATTGAGVDGEDQLVAPRSIRSDALQLLLSDVRAGERSEEEALDAHERITEIRIRLLGDRVSRRLAWRIARDLDWDDLRAAEYLAVARLQADVLVTGDPGLADRAEGLVPVTGVERWSGG
jgi:hypothetical protein